MLCPSTMSTSPFSVPLPKSWPEYAKAATPGPVAVLSLIPRHPSSRRFDVEELGIGKSIRTAAVVA